MLVWEATQHHYRGRTITRAIPAATAGCTSTVRCRLGASCPTRAFSGMLGCTALGKAAEQNSASSQRGQIPTKIGTCCYNWLHLHSVLPLGCRLPRRRVLGDTGQHTNASSCRTGRAMML